MHTSFSDLDGHNVRLRFKKINSQNMQRSLSNHDTLTEVCKMLISGGNNLTEYAVLRP